MSKIGKKTESGSPTTDEAGNRVSTAEKWLDKWVEKWLKPLMIMMIMMVIIKIIIIIITITITITIILHLTNDKGVLVG